MKLNFRSFKAFALESLFYIIFLAACLVSLPSHGQQMTVGTGSNGGTYSAQYNNITKVCSKDITLVEWKDPNKGPNEGKPSNGAVKNAELLIGNEVNGGWVQADILYMMARTQDLSDIKTLLVLNPESLHYVVKANLAVKQGGTLGIGATVVPIRELSQIGGMKVAASGGGAWTAKQVRLETEIPHEIVEVPDSKAAIAALDKGDVQVALIVGGFPMDYLKTLSKDYRILTVSEAVRTKLAKVYNPAQVSYSNLADGGAAQTVSVQSLFVVREYKSAKMVSALSALRGCVLGNLDDIKETTGNHASWRMVKAENQQQAKWPLYQLPTTTSKK